MYFQYGSTEMEYLKKKDPKLKEVIEKIGFIKKEVDTDLFSAVVHHIVGQQISMKAQKAIWKRVCDGLGKVTAASVLEAGIEGMQSFGLSLRKAEYSLDFARKVQVGEFDLEEVGKRGSRSHSGSNLFKRNWSMDGRNDSPFLYGTSECI